MESSEVLVAKDENAPPLAVTHVTLAESLPPISTVPPELLSKIFLLDVEASLHLVCDGSYHDIEHLDISQTTRDHDCRPKIDGSRYWRLLTLSHVCATWKALVWGSMVLWNRLDVTHLTDAEQRFGEGCIPIPTSGPLFVSVDYILDCAEGESNLTDFVDERPSFLTKTVQYFVQRVLPHRERIVELTFTLPPPVIFHLFRRLLPQTGVTFPSLTNLVFAFRYRPTHESIDFDRTSERTTVPLLFPVLRDLHVLGCMFGEDGHRFVRAMVAPQAKYHLGLIGGFQALTPYFTPDVEDIQPLRIPNAHITYKMIYPASGCPEISPHDLEYSTTSTPVPSFELMWKRMHIQDRGPVPMLALAASMLTKYAGAALTELAVSVADLYLAICATELYEGFDEQDDIEFYQKSERKGDPIPFLVEDGFSGNPYLDSFMTQWYLLLTMLPEINHIRLLALDALEMECYRSSEIMPLLFTDYPATQSSASDSDGPPKKPVTLRAKSLTRLDLEFGVTAVVEVSEGEVEIQVPDSFLSWLDTTITFRRLHGVPLTEVNLKAVWSYHWLKQGSEDVRSAHEGVTERFQAEIRRIKEEVDSLVTVTVHTDDLLY